MDYSNTEIKRINFVRTETGKVEFTEQNMKTLLQYVIPIIQRNEGWDTKDLTKENFIENPERWRIDIDATLQTRNNAEVYIALYNGKSVGLLMYLLDEISNSSNDTFIHSLLEMTHDYNHELWKKLIDMRIISKNILMKYFSNLKGLIEGKYFYSRISIVLLPELQGKKTGISDKLYGLMKNGFVFGRTSTPQALAKRRKVFKMTKLSPIRENEVTSVESLTIAAILAARSFSKDYMSMGEYELGVGVHSGFASRDKEKYTKLSKSFLDNGKITLEEYNKLVSLYDIEKAQAAIISITN